MHPVGEQGVEGVRVCRNQAGAIEGRGAPEGEGNMHVNFVPRENGQERLVFEAELILDDYGPNERVRGML